MASPPKSTTQEPPIVTRTLCVRLYPGTAANGQYLEQLAGACRFTWNHVPAGHEMDYRKWKASGKLGMVPAVRPSSRWAGGSRSCGTHPATSGCRITTMKSAGTLASTWATPTPHSSTRICPTMGVRSTRPSSTHNPPWHADAWPLTVPLQARVGRTAAAASPGTFVAAGTPS